MEPVPHIVYSCKFPNCRSAAYRNIKNRKRFFRFPRDLNLRQQWKQACNIKDNSVNVTNFRVCEDHFQQYDVLNTPLSRLGAVPVHSKELLRRALKEHDYFGGEENDDNTPETIATAEIVGEELLSPEAATFVQQVEADLPQSEDTFVLVEADLSQLEEHYEIKMVPFTYILPVDSSIPFEEENVCTESEALNSLMELPVVQDTEANISPVVDEKPYFKSVKCYLSESNRITEVCRICFRTLGEEEVIKLYDETEPNASHIKNMLKLVLPDLDLNTYPNSVICTKCSELLTYSYQLKETWLLTEEKLQKIITKRKSVTNRDADLVIIAKNVGNKCTQNLNDEKKSKTSINLNDILPSNTSNGISLFYGELTSDDSVKPKYIPKVTTSKKKYFMWGNGPFMCEFCGRLYKSAGNLRRHFRSHTVLKVRKKRNKRVCEICGELFVSLHAHLRIHTEHRCTVCNKQFRWNAQLIEHMNVVHFKMGRSFQCHLCGRQYFRKSTLRLHLRKIHNPQKPHFCNICDRRFAFHSSLRRHVIRHIQGKRWTCNYCGRIIKHEKNLYTHIQIFHKNEGKYVCDICDKPYWRKLTLENHKYRIHGIVPVQKVNNC